MNKRTAGLLYLLPMALGPFSMMFVPSRVMVANDAQATLEHLRASEPLFRLGLASDLVIVLAEVALTAVLFVLFEHVSRAWALTATFARLVMTGLQGANVFLLVGALQTAARGDSTQTLVLLEVHAQAMHVWETVFALHCLALAVLVTRSGFVPRLFGPLLAVAGLGYALNGLGSLLVVSAAPVFARIVGVTAVVGEVPFVFWLLLGRAPRLSTSSM
jgi:Domain of unknown function (DUF4386)